MKASEEKLFIKKIFFRKKNYTVKQKLRKMSTKLNYIVLLLILIEISNGCSTSDGFNQSEEIKAEEPETEKEEPEVISADLKAYKNLIAHKFGILTNYLKSSQDPVKPNSKRGHIWEKKLLKEHI